MSNAGGSAGPSSWSVWTRRQADRVSSWWQGSQESQQPSQQSQLSPQSQILRADNQLHPHVPGGGSSGQQRRQLPIQQRRLSPAQQHMGINGFYTGRASHDPTFRGVRSSPDDEFRQRAGGLGRVVGQDEDDSYYNNLLSQQELLQQQQETPPAGISRNHAPAASGVAGAASSSAARGRPSGQEPVRSRGLHGASRRERDPRRLGEEERGEFAPPLYHLDPKPVVAKKNFVVPRSNRAQESFAGTLRRAARTGTAPARGKRSSLMNKFGVQKAMDKKSRSSAVAAGGFLSDIRWGSVDLFRVIDHGSVEIKLKASVHAFFVSLVTSGNFASLLSFPRSCGFPSTRIDCRSVARWQEGFVPTQDERTEFPTERVGPVVSDERTEFPTERVGPVSRRTLAATRSSPSRCERERPRGRSALSV